MSASWIGRKYVERGRLVTVLARWNGAGPRNVLIRRSGGEIVVRPFRGLRKVKTPEQARHVTPEDAK